MVVAEGRWAQMESFVKCLLLRRIYVFGVWYSLRHAIFVGRRLPKDALEP